MSRALFAVVACVACVVLGGVMPPAAHAHAADLMAGKHRTAHTVRLEAIVDASPESVYTLWTTEAGVARFFAPRAQIELRPGGAYTMLFAPNADPEGLNHGTKGAHILRVEPGRALSFEWIAFAADTTLGANAPPVAPRALRDATPLPTWVELRFDPAPGQPGKTRVRLAHYGFREGPLWDASYAWFTRAWGHVLDGLAASCAKDGGVAAAH